MYISFYTYAGNLTVTKQYLYDNQTAQSNMVDTSHITIEHLKNSTTEVKFKLSHSFQLPEEKNASNNFGMRFFFPRINFMKFKFR